MELKEFVESFQSDWTAFKKTNDELIKAKADGKSVSEFEAKLAKIDERLTAHQDMADRLKRMETAMHRTSGEVKGDCNTPEKMEHKAAFETWLRKGEDERKLAELEKKALAVGDDTGGGFMVHADLSGRITRRIFETSPIRAYASVQTISTDALEGVVDSNEAAGGWVAETGARPTTNTPKLGTWRIPTHEIYAQPAATQKLLDDASWNSEEWLSAKVGDRISRYENAAFVLGDGIGKPRGFLSYTAVAEDPSLNYFSAKNIGYIATGTADDFAPVPSSGANPAQADSLISLVYSLKSQYREMAGTAFGMHRTTYGRVRRLRDNLGNYLWQPGLGAAPATLLGYPIAEFNDMPKLGDSNKFPVAFGNWREAYQIVDRQGVRVLRDPFTSKPYVLFYSVKRTGGDVVNFEAIKLLKAATS